MGVGKGNVGAVMERGSGRQLGQAWDIMHTVSRQTREKGR